MNDKARVSPRWDMYTRMIDGHLGSLRLNLGLNSWKREGDVKEIFFLFIRKFFGNFSRVGLLDLFFFYGFEEKVF